MEYRKAAWTILIVMIIGKSLAQNKPVGIPAIIEKEGRHALIVDGKPFFILGGQAHNSSAWPALLPRVWASIEQMHANTLEVPVYWEQLEPQAGKFDFSIIDTLLAQAHEHHARLVLLWFATWKNGSSHYMPAWMKQDPSKYTNITGQKGQPIDSPSPFVTEAMEKDRDAFAALMSHLKSSDHQHTVIMVQVENEPGAWGSVRDYSAAAQKLFEGSVPAALLKPELLKELQVPVVPGGSWQKVFGDRADEYFHAWYVASYVGQVAKAGKAVYPLPLYVNAALRDPLTNPTANNYESGGATDNVIPIWKIAAPAIDLLAPDIYLPGTERVLKILELYNRSDNALFVPEANLVSENAKWICEVFARGGIGFSPFGIDDTENPNAAAVNERLIPFAREYAMASPMMEELAKWSFEGKLRSAVEREDHADQSIDLKSWQAIVSFGVRTHGKTEPNSQANGKIMIAQLAEDEFIITGTLSHIRFQPLGKNSGKAWQYLKVEEGYYENGVFKASRILNGDETDWGGPKFDAVPSVLHVTLITR